MIEFQVFEANPQAMRIALIGRLDSAGVEKIEAPLTASVRDGSLHILFDLSKVPFVGSLGIRLLISVGRVLQRQDRRLVMFGAQPQVAEVFETVTLSDLIPITGSEDEALAELA